MSIKYRLGFDIDEVVCSTIKTIIKLMKEFYNIDWSYEKFNSYSFEKTEFVKGNKTLNKKISDHLVTLVNDPEVHLSFEPYEEAVRCIRRYKDKGHSIHFISNRPLEKEDVTMKWLRRNNIPVNSLHHAGWKVKKGTICENLELDFYIDDHTECLESLTECKKRWRKGLFLMDRPWNQGYENENVVRVRNWKEVDKHLNL
jgi:uncharacterized HAD superfamily protein